MTEPQQQTKDLKSNESIPSPDSTKLDALFDQAMALVHKSVTAGSLTLKALAPKYTQVKFKLGHTPLTTVDKTYIELAKNKTVITVKGRVERAAQIFVHMSDTPLKDPVLQLVVPKPILTKLLYKLHKATTIEATGIVVLTPEKKNNKEITQKYEMQVQTLQIVGPVRDPDTFLPSFKTPVSLDTWRKNMDTRMHDPILAAIGTIRSDLSGYLQDFMDTQLPTKAYRLDPNVITNADCEGAGEMFVISTLLNDDGTPIIVKKPKPELDGDLDLDLDALDDRKSSAPMTDKKTVFAELPKLDWTTDHFENEEPARLTVSSQLGLEYQVPIFDIVWTFNPSFRAEKSDTNRHLAEFRHFEVEIKSIEFADLLDFQEQLATYCFQRVLDDSQSALKVLETSENGKGVTEKLRSFVSKPFDRVSYTDALNLLTQKQEDVLKQFPQQKTIPAWGDDLGSWCERYLSETFYKHPTFLINMPRDLKSFYMRQNENEGKEKETVQGGDLLIPYLGELMGSSMREHRYAVLLANCLRKKHYRVKNGSSSSSSSSSKLPTDAQHQAIMTEMSAIIVDEKNDGVKQMDALVQKHGVDFRSLTRYLNLRRNGGVVSGGFGMGFERLVAVCTSGRVATPVRDCTPFPVWYRNCAF